MSRRDCRGSGDRESYHGRNWINDGRRKKIPGDKLKQILGHERRFYTASIASNVLIILVALAVVSILVFITGGNPVTAYFSIFRGALTTKYGLTSTINLTSILLLTGLSAAIAFKCNVWNIGAEGQLYMGAAGATIIGLSSIHSVLQLPSALLLGFLLGALWGLIPGILKVRFSVDEVVSTILMNFIAILFIDYLVTYPLKDTTQAYNQSPPIALTSRLPIALPGTKLNASILIALILAFLIFMIIFKMKIGYEIRIIGGNIRAAEYIGVNVTRTVSLVMLISGGLAGLAGSLLVTGTTHILLVGISRFYGYTGIAVAWLANLHPLGAIPSALFFACLDVGGDTMQRTTGISHTLVPVITAIIIIIILFRPLVEEKLR